MTSTLIVVACVVAAVASYIAARFIVIPLLRRRGVLDHPSARSSHQTPVPRGGGIAVAGGVLVGGVVVFFWHVTPGAGGSLLLPFLPVVSAVLFGIIGLIDDLNSLSAVSRLVTQVVLAGALAAVIGVISGVGALAMAAIVLSIILIVNATNFMDGLNTLMTVWGAMVSLWFGLLALSVDRDVLAGVSLAFGAALIGFLPLNWSPAQSFLGDVGSYLIGGFVSVALWVLWSEGVAVTALVAPLVVPLFDVLFTLGHRIYRGENLFTAHRTHIYQKLQAAGLTHEQASLVHAGMVVVCVLPAIPSVVGVTPGAPYVAVSLWLGVAAVYVSLPSLAGRSAERKSA